MKCLILWATLLLSIIIPSVSVAEEYAITVTQVGGNLFWEPEREIYIQTEYCFVDIGTKEVVLNIVDEAGSLIISDKTSCEIKNIFGKAQLEAGAYTITVSREDDNWYTIDGQEAALNTEGCLGSVENVAAELTVEENGSGTLKLADEECSVKGIYSKATVE